MAQGHLRKCARLMRAARSERTNPSPFIGPLPSRKLRRGFSYLPYPELHLNSCPAWPGRKTRIPGSLTSVCVTHPKRGACRRERGASRTPMAERTRMGSLWRRAVESAATEFLFCNFALPHLAAQRTLVVKISDTSHTTEPISPVPQRAFCDCRTQQCASAWRW